MRFFFLRRNLGLLAAGLILLYGIVFSQTADLPEAKEVIATGTGSIIGGDVAHARDDAIEDALRTGIEQVIGILVESESIVQNFQLLEDNIFSKTQGYVQSYEVIQEGNRDDQLYEVKVKAVIKTADLKNDLEGIATLIRRKNTPRLMVVIEERNIGETTSSHYFEADMNIAETALTEAFMAKGFRFVDQATVKRNLNRQTTEAILEGNAAKAAAMGRSVGAEVVITGKALAKATEVEVYGTKIRSQQATISARAIRTDTGDIIAIGSEDGKFSHIDDIVGGTKAIQKACNKLAANLITKILDQWQTDVSSGMAITLEVQGVNFEQLNRLKSGLKYYVRGATSVVQRDWYDGYATLEITMKGSSSDLAKAISNKTIEGMQVKVLKVSPNSVTMQVVSPQTPARVPVEADSTADQP